MALSDVQARIKAVSAEIDDLMATPNLTAEQTQKLNTLLEEGAGLRSRLETLRRADDFQGWTRQRGTGLPLAGKANVEGIRQSGRTQIEALSDSLVISQEGEGVFDPKLYEIISNPSYAKAFRNYLRMGDRRISRDDELTLAPGADPMGGYFMPLRSMVDTMAPSYRGTQSQALRAFQALRVLQEGSVTGDALVPEEILNRLVAREPAPTSVAAKVSTFPTSRDRIVMPRVNYSSDDIYTTGIRATWTGEQPASSAAHRVTDPVFGTIGISVYTAMLSLPLTNDLVEDSAFPIVSYSSGKFGETIQLLRENMVINGSGVNQPTGILLNPVASGEGVNYVVSGDANLVTADGLMDLTFALPPQYDEKASFVMNKTSTAKAISKLKDGQGRYIWGQGYNDSGLAVNWRNRNLMGYEVNLCQFMPDVKANAYPVIFGDLTGYYLVDRIALSIQVLREIYAETNQILLLGRVRFGGAPVETWRLKAQKIAAA